MIIIETFKFLAEQLNNREIAILIWLAMTLVVSLFFSWCREQLWYVVKFYSCPKIYFFLLLFSIYVSGLCFLLSKISLWSAEQLVTTFLWCFASGTYFITHAINKQDKNAFVKKLFWGTLTISGVVEFIILKFTSSFAVEFAIVSILIILLSIVEFPFITERYKKLAPYKSVIKDLVLIFFVFFIGRFIIKILLEPSAFFTIDSLYSFLTPILLTIGVIPLFYLFYSNYEDASRY